jgi:WD40 repeat protein
VSGLAQHSFFILITAQRGGAAISVKDDAYILDDTSQGVALYKLSGSERVKTFAIDTNEQQSRNVCFHDGGKAIVTGSEHGDVYVFDRRTGEVNDIINVGCKDWVQSVTVRNFCNNAAVTASDAWHRQQRWRVYQ